jgi:Cu/Ag efflux pump CusA
VGYSVVYGGQFENQQRAQAKLMIVVPISLGLFTGRCNFRGLLHR